MVVGRKTNPSPRSATSIQIDYLITIQQIKPWPPSPLLGSLRSLLIQWENGESSCGFTRPVVPVPKSSSIEFNESFHLPLTLQKDLSSTKPPGNAAFSKNNLVLNLYEPPRRDSNITKGKLIATAMVDLADYGVVEEALRVRAALNCKRSFRNMVQPFLYVDILPVDKARSCGSLSKEVRLTESEFESVTDSMINDEYEDAFSSSASGKYRRGGFPTQNRQVNSTDEIFLQKSTRVDIGDGKNGEDGYEEPEHHYLMEEANSTEDGVAKISAEADQNPGIRAFSFSWGKLAVEDDVLTDDIQHVKSVKSSSSDTARSNGNHLEEEHEHAEDGGSPQEEQVARQQRIIRDTKTNITDRRRSMSDAKVQHLQRRIQMLEGELREAAAMEVALYSVVAEHGNSVSKTHAPARRLSRLYRHSLSQSWRASAARSALSGLVLVVKACGNDVPRLTFWLSNSIMLRAILSPAIVKKKSSQQSFLSKKSDKNNRAGDQDKDEELENFIADIEKIEAWIFSRIVESIWWQILIPHMQSTAARRINRGKPHGSDSNNSRRLALAHAEEQAQADISLGIWKAAFKDACERLCPVRARGQTCGCLSLPAQLIMEQCVARLDVAMFNALLRESDDDIPTDPISDPISDPKVLPIPAGKLSFRAGAQLKNVIGNWSRWLTNLLGIDSNESDEDVSETQDTPFRSFRLLYALSDLVMLPKDLLLNQSTRKEVCPTFGALLILRVLENFVPDEFCPEPVPEEVLEALIHEDPCECGAEELLNMYPCIAASPVYLPPSAASISVKSLQKSDGSLMKSQNSDDELDQVSSPLASISLHASSSSPISTLASSLWKETGNRNVCRYELLRDIWMDCE